MIPDPQYDAYMKTLRLGPLHSIQRLLGDLAVESELHGENQISILFIQHKLEDILNQGGINPPTPGNWVPLDRFPELEDIESQKEEK